MKDTEEDYLEKTSSAMWTLDDFCSWCANERFMDRKKILDHIKRRLQDVNKTKLIPEEMRQKAFELLENLKARDYLFLRVATYLKRHYEDIEGIRGALHEAQKLVGTKKNPQILFEDEVLTLPSPVDIQENES
ncbi:hypothetical protein G9A89_012225 [Geosiphon pyriformis]|nr:hypothetical protein G9A89_012225 [Geosiphon pyriformis]